MRFRVLSSLPARSVVPINHSGFTVGAGFQLALGRMQKHENHEKLFYHEKHKNPRKLFYHENHEKTRKAFL